MARGGRNAPATRATISSGVVSHPTQYSDDRRGTRRCERAVSVRLIFIGLGNLRPDGAIAGRHPDREGPLPGGQQSRFVSGRVPQEWAEDQAHSSA